jgi:hypothetical protein
MALTIPRHLNFHRFDQIKVAHYQLLQTFIKSVEIKVAPHPISGNLGDMEQYAPRNSKRHKTVSATEQLAPRNRHLLDHGCAADFSLLNLPKGKSLGRSKPATNS